MKSKPLNKDDITPDQMLRFAGIFMACMNNFGQVSGTEKLKHDADTIVNYIIDGD